MLLASVGMCVASWAGTLAGLSPAWAILLCAIAAAMYAKVSQHSQAASWIALQCLVWLVISTAYPAHGVHALTRGVMILLGGLLQTAVVGAWAQYERWRHKYSKQEVATILSAPADTKAHPLKDEYPGVFAVRSAATLGIAAALYKALPAQNAYWIPMTAAIILRPQLRDTLHRGMMRLIGTMAGALIATLIVLIAPQSPWMLTAGVILFAWASYVLFHVNYMYFAVCLTAYVVFLLTLAGYMEEPLVERRILFTAMGGALSLIMHYVARQTVRAVAPSPQE